MALLIEIPCLLFACIARYAYHKERAGIWCGIAGKFFLLCRGLGSFALIGVWHARVFWQFVWARWS